MSFERFFEKIIPVKPVNKSRRKFVKTLPLAFLTLYLAGCSHQKPVQQQEAGSNKYNLPSLCSEYVDPQQALKNYDSDPTLFELFKIVLPNGNTVYVRNYDKLHVTVDQTGIELVYLLYHQLQLTDVINKDQLPQLTQENIRHQEKEYPSNGTVVIIQEKPSSVFKCLPGGIAMTRNGNSSSELSVSEVPLERVKLGYSPEDDHYEEYVSSTLIAAFAKEVGQQHSLFKLDLANEEAVRNGFGWFCVYAGARLDLNDDEAYENYLKYMKDQKMQLPNGITVQYALFSKEFFIKARIVLKGQTILRWTK